MLTFVTIIHVLLCVFMIFVILLQPGKDAGMGAALGGGAATSAFGGRGAVTFLSKVTAASAILFFITSLGLSFVGLRSSVAAGGDDAPAATAPAVPGGEATTAPIEGGSTGGEVQPSTGAPTLPDQGTAEPVNAAPHGGDQPTAPPSQQ